MRRKGYRTQEGEAHRGAVLVDYAMSLSIFLFILLSLSDLARLAFYSASIQYSVAAGSRWAIMGLSLPDPNHPGTNYSREESIKRTIMKYSAQYGAPLTLSEIHMCRVGVDPLPCVTDNAGVGGDVIQISAAHPVRAVFRLLTISLTGSVVVKNEGF